MYKYRLIMKDRREPEVIVDAHVVDREKLYEKFGKEDHVVDLNGKEKFNCFEVKRASKFWEIDPIRNEVERQDTLPSEKRHENIQRLEAYSKASQGRPCPEDFTANQREWYDEMRLCITEGIYSKSDWRNAAGIRRRDWQQARKVFSDVRFDSVEHEQSTLKVYFYQYVKGNADPRNFDRDEFVHSCRDQSYAQAVEVFHA